jgi:hypothetical protein
MIDNRIRTRDWIYVVLFGFLMLVAGMGFFVHRANVFRGKISELEGLTESEVLRKVGKPLQEHTPQEFASWNGFAKSVEPDPPLIHCDSVWGYQEDANVSFLYFKDGRVIYVHHGGT